MSPPAVLPTAPATRADILHVGRAASPWSFVPIAYQALEQQPGDEDVRFLLIQHLAALGLRTAAIEQIAAFSTRASSDPRILDAVKAINALPDDRIPFSSLEATCLANVDALARKPEHAVNLKLHLGAWRKHSAQFEWFTAANGNIVRRRRTADGRTIWLNFADTRTGADAYRSSADEKPGTSKAPASPIVIEGVDPPWLFRRVCQQLPPRPDGYWAPITIVQADPLEFLDGLAQIDLTQELAQTRVRAFIGPNAGQRFADELLRLERLDCVITGPVFTSTTLRTRAAIPPALSIQNAEIAQTTSWDITHPIVLHRYAPRNPAWYAARFAQAVADSPARAPLKILVITCRYSTFVKHSAADLAKAFESLGHSVRLLMEPDDSSWLRPLAILRAVHDHDPDLLVTINHPRSEMRDCLPPQLPVLTWVQDAMPHLLTREAGARIGPLDFFTGNIYHEHVERYGYPLSQLLPATIVASSTKFHTGPVAAAASDRFACEIAYVSHHSETPEALHARHAAQMRDQPTLVKALDHLFPKIIAASHAALDAQLCLLLPDLIRQTLTDHHLTGADEDYARLLHTYAYPIADRAIRHQTLEWAAAIARKHSWRLHLYGRGWDNHPTLAEFARGPLGHDDDLRACYAGARAHLQMTVHRAMHQRVVECALSGGFPLLRLHADDLAVPSFQAAFAASKRTHPTACHIPLTARLGSSVIGFPAPDHPEGRRLNALRERLGLPPQDFLWAAISHFSRAVDAMGGGEEYDLFWQLGDPADLCFATPETLEDRLMHAVSDPSWRENASNHLRTRSTSHLTHQVFAPRLLAFIASRLNTPASHG